MSKWEVPRREPRYRFHVSVILHLGRERVELVTEDVSFSGMFLRTDEPPPERGLIKITVQMPNALPMDLMAVVVHHVPPGSERLAGAGVQLYGVGGSVRDQWARHIITLRTGQNDAASQPVTTEPLRRASAGDDRRHARFVAVLAVRSDNLDALVMTYTRDISQGGTFLRTRAKLAAGDRLFLELLHPESGEYFGLACAVRRVVRDGVGVEFTDLDNAKRAQFWEFVEPALEIDAADVIVVE